MSVVDIERHGTVVCRIHDKVWRYLLHVLSLGFPERGSRLRVKPEEFGMHLFGCCLVHFRLPYDFVPALVHELVEMVFYHCFHEFRNLRLGLSPYLQQQTFFQVSSPDSCRIEGLKNFYHLFHFIFRAVDVVVYGEFVTDAVGRFPQQSVAVERPYNILHYLLLLVGKLYFAHLFL